MLTPRGDEIGGCCSHRLRTRPRVRLSDAQRILEGGQRSTKRSAMTPWWQDGLATHPKDVYRERSFAAEHGRLALVLESGAPGISFGDMRPHFFHPARKR